MKSYRHISIWRPTFKHLTTNFLNYAFLDYNYDFLFLLDKESFSYIWFRLGDVYSKRTLQHPFKIQHSIS